MDLGLDGIESLDHGVHAASSLMVLCFRIGRMLSIQKAHTQHPCEDIPQITPPSTPW